MAVALVTGSSTGIGLATALHLARNGYEVYATMRNPDRGGKDVVAAAAAEGLPVHVLPLDVDDAGSVSAAVDESVGRSGRIDVLVNNAGIGAGGAIETTSDEDLKRVFETNFFGALRMVRAVLPAMRERRNGAIVNVTSQGGRVTMEAVGPYCASKFALEAASESLAMEVAPFGVRVVIIEPGVILTPIFGKAPPPPPPDSPYARGARRFAMNIAALLQAPTMPDEVAATILEAITTPAPRLRYTVGSEAESLLRSRAAITDEEWIAIGNMEDDAEYMARMSGIWGEKLSARSRATA